MKLKKGQTVHVGKEKFVGEIPDEKAIALGLLKEKEDYSKGAKSE